MTPLGLFGELRMMARVRGVMAASSLAEVRREIGPRRHHHQPAAVVLRVERVLDEERRHRDHLVAGIQERLQHGVERGAGAHRHEHVVGRVRQPGGRPEPAGHRLAHARMAGVGHVGVQVELLAVEHAPGGGQHGRRRLDLGIAQREVEDLVRAALLLEPGAFLEHAANPRRLGQIVGDGPGSDHGGSIGQMGRSLTAEATP